nr:MAG TPA: hypothetical protein [Caudoviricetes sp.]
MTELVKLQAPEGFTDVSFGSQSYEVGENGVVEVPAEAVQFLYQFGFGNVAEEPAEAEEPEKGKRGRKAKAEQAAEAVEPDEAEQAETEEPAEAEKTE